MEKGLYKNELQYYVAVDCIIFGFDEGELKLLLVKRNIEPEKDKWSLMGGFIQPTESADEAAKRVLFTLTGLENVYLEQLHAFGEVKRDPVARVISIAYYSLINIHQHDEELARKNSAYWFPISDFPTLIFDHNEMVVAAKKQLKNKATIKPIGFELLPEKFTIPQLQQLYEAIYETDLDKRNFSRKILTMDILEKLTEKQRGVSRKGAYFYKFNKAKYEYKTSNGFNFDI